MKLFIYTLLLFLPFTAYAAAPDDINTNQRAWFDAVDVDANGSYTDNPADSALISQWSDKSGSANHISATGVARPKYLVDSLGSERHGLDFDGISNNLVDNNDIWVGAVSSSESFVVVTTEQIRASFAFLSSHNGTNRLGVHIPWSNSTTYFDQGICCGAPTRLQGSVPISLGEQYFWHFIGLSNDQSILQDGKSYLSDTGASIYNVYANSYFVLGSANNTRFHEGRFFEAIFYQTELNDAQRYILSNYLSAKWDKAFAASPTFSDVYSGDDAVNGDYDYFVGGIGRLTGTQASGTSQGLTITNDTFLNSNEQFILAGVDYLTSTPKTGTSSSELPSGYLSRSNRSWYIDRTGDNGLVNLSFNVTDIGIAVDNGSEYGLLHRVGTSGNFTSVATATMAGGVITFSHLPDDGVYTIGKKGIMNITLEKVGQTVKDPLNNGINPKAIPGSIIDYTLTIKNRGNLGPDLDTTLIKDTLQSQLTLFTGDLDGNGSPFVFTDNNCPPETVTTNSDLTLDYPSDVVFKDVLGNVVMPSMTYDPTIRSFEITLSGLMNSNYQADVPCFTMKYRVQLQ
ncbi:hypothetical protein [Leucothrix arctica]|uniref:DUF11 domain-containing protein n=1 Tax=Leucothrix arctica TaxID=1481894 RepID=A0A317C4F3_9GAMM|nr:hypothetical protein [Leucothrix arctica]PWQ93525.1 hypothetical protein DKT75_18065 [Leucothrix arctica]